MTAGHDREEGRDVKVPGFWLLMIVSAGALVFIWTVVHVGRLLERLRGGDVHPGEPRVYAPSDFGAADDQGDKG